jgi:hypothetical protein
MTTDNKHLTLTAEFIKSAQHHFYAHFVAMQKLQYDALLSSDIVLYNDSQVPLEDSMYSYALLSALEKARQSIHHDAPPLSKDELHDICIHHHEDEELVEDIVEKIWDYAQKGGFLTPCVKRPSLPMLFGPNH